MSSGKIFSPASLTMVNRNDRLAFIKKHIAIKGWRFIANLPLLIYRCIPYVRRNDLLANRAAFRQLFSMPFVFYNDDRCILFKNIKL